MSGEPQAQFWDDPALKPFREKFMAKWNEEVVKPLERDLGVKFDDYHALLQGQIIHLVNNAINVIAQRGALRFNLAVMRQQFIR